MGDYRIKSHIGIGSTFPLISSARLELPQSLQVLAAYKRVVSTSSATISLTKVISELIQLLTHSLPSLLR